MRFLSQLVSILSLACVVAAPGRAVADTAVTFCGQEVVGDGFLAADLDCTGFPEYAVNLVGGTLSLGGYTLTGGDFGSAHCPKKCEVIGPGTITGSGFAGIVAFGPLRTLDVDLTNHVAYGLECFKSCKIEGGTISGNGDGVVGGAGVKMSGVTIVGNAGYGARAPKAIVIRDSSISGNGDEGVSSERKVSVRDSTITGNAEHGIRAGSSDCSRPGVVRLKNTNATGNATSLDCWESEPCADVASCRRPAVKDGSACNRSYVLNSGFPGDDWDVCAFDP